MTLEDLQHGARPYLVAIAVAGLAAGLAAHAAGAPGWAEGLWSAATLPVLAALVVEIVTSLRRGELGLDIVAALSMTAALVFGEALAAAVVALMYAGGQYLELFAEQRARREMTALLARAPRTAMRHRDGGLEEVALDAIAPGDRLLIRAGRRGAGGRHRGGGRDAGQVGADRRGAAGAASARRGGDERAGQRRRRLRHDRVARRPRRAPSPGSCGWSSRRGRSKAPMVRLADRFAIWFLGLTLAIAGAAWALTGDPVRAVAVLVVATPCPLILAVPVAFVAGLSRAARHGILIKGARPLEAMARVAVLVLDKTGTLTDGRPRLVATRVRAGFAEAEVLRLAASLDQASKHTVARTVVEAARAARPGARGSRSGGGERRRRRRRPRRGPRGDGRRPGLRGGDGSGSRRTRPSRMPGAIIVAVGVDGGPAGELVLTDALRPGTAGLLAELRTAGSSGWSWRPATGRTWRRRSRAGLGFDAVRAGLTPEAKVLLVLAERKFGPVMMVGDGVNDAPALAAADIGVAMGARGAAAAAEAADVVLLVDRLDRLLLGLGIARRSRRIALESVVAGIGLSVAGMLAAAWGVITPVQGALLQEAIDVAVILNALRALGAGFPGREPRRLRNATPEEAKLGG